MNWKGLVGQRQEGGTLSVLYAEYPQVSYYNKPKTFWWFGISQIIRIELICFSFLIL